jgi:hypothetical protein
MRNVAQADERVSASWSLAERALSRITAIHFPASHARYRQMIGGAVADGAQQHPKAHYVDELEAARERMAAVNGQGIPLVEMEPEDEA